MARVYSLRPITRHATYSEASTFSSPPRVSAFFFPLRTLHARFTASMCVCVYRFTAHTRPSRWLICQSNEIINRRYRIILRRRYIVNTGTADFCVFRKCIRAAAFFFPRGRFWLGVFSFFAARRYDL